MNLSNARRNALTVMVGTVLAMGAVAQAGAQTHPRDRDREDRKEELQARKHNAAPDARAAAQGQAADQRAAKRHAIAYVKRYAITLRKSDLDLQCSVTGRSRWKCFVGAALRPAAARHLGVSRPA